MRHILPSLVFSGLVALGLAVAMPSAGASAFSVGGATANTVKAVEATNNGGLFEVHDRRYHHRWHRGHRDRHWRHRRPRSGIYFEFGTGGFRTAPPPYYTRPRYVRPRYVEPRPVYRLSSAHVQWCYNRYRSYRDWDNTFQPYNGPRRACISPYMR
ncbi:BA14K family protein [Chelativorans salis]|uniref:Lectin-like protein BA14k n=1 Tax=Chelativorans salis TaxID=2978478 RepID=A0ABT2LKM9_9HYPH|nr:BA14K family protein [Chelativorans sp. EGI FJ00035]MCT7375146.1 BA14K family protein [Chelativorans sp. EGI FJ00035]